jgi:hypothetical protein
LDEEKPKHAGLAQQNGLFAQVAEASKKHKQSLTSD